MEQEVFCSGYCRALDQSRMVAVVTEDGNLVEVDCGYAHCIYAPSCPVAREIDELQK